MGAQRNESDWRTHREMAKDLREICVEAVSVCEDLPEAAKENKNAVGLIEITNFDQSYIEFLDGQIALAPRGPEWNERLKIRRANLAPHTDRELASCRLQFGTDDYWIKIDPVAKCVVHWEVYDETE